MAYNQLLQINNKLPPWQGSARSRSAQDPNVVDQASGPDARCNEGDEVLVLRRRWVEVPGATDLEVFGLDVVVTQQSHAAAPRGPWATP